MCGRFNQSYAWHELAELYRLTQPARNLRPIQHRPDNDGRCCEIGRNQPGACPDVLGSHSWLVENNYLGSANDVQRAGRDHRAKAMFRVLGRGDDDPRLIEPVEDDAIADG